MTMFVVFLVLVGIGAGAKSCMQVVPAGKAYVIERFGSVRQLDPGVHWVLPGVDRVQPVDLRPKGCETDVECKTVDGSTVWITVNVIERVVDPLSAFEHRHVVGRWRQVLGHVVGSAVATRSDHDTALKRDELAAHIQSLYGPLRMQQGLVVDMLTISRVTFEPAVADSHRAVLVAGAVPNGSIVPGPVPWQAPRPQDRLQPPPGAVPVQ